MLADVTWLGRDDRLHAYEAGKHYPMPAAVAHAAAKRDLVARTKPPRWVPPSILRPPEVLSEIEVAKAAAELQALERHAGEAVAAVPGGGPSPLLSKGRDACWSEARLARSGRFGCSQCLEPRSLISRPGASWGLATEQGTHGLGTPLRARRLQLARPGRSPARL